MYNYFGYQYFSLYWLPRFCHDNESEKCMQLKHLNKHVMIYLKSVSLKTHWCIVVRSFIFDGIFNEVLYK